MNGKPAIIFDFDGTIADSLPVVIAIYKELLPHKAELTQDDFRRLRRMPAHKVARELGIPFWRAPAMLNKGRRLMRQRLDQVKLFPGLAEVLKELKQRGYQLYIVSSNSTSNVDIFLAEHGIADCFVHIEGGSSLFAKAKVLRKLMKRKKLDVQRTFYVGDEARDITATRQIGMPIVSVAWGFNDVELLREMQPEKIALTPADLLKIFA